MENHYPKNSSPPSVYSSAISTGGLNSFVSENDLEERRRKRQEEWEKVRKPDDPIGNIHHLFNLLLYLINNLYILTNRST